MRRSTGQEQRKRTSVCVRISTNCLSDGVFTYTLNGNYFYLLNDALEDKVTGSQTEKVKERSTEKETRRTKT